MAAAKKRYTVEVDGISVYESARIDHASNRFDKEIKDTSKDVVLVDNKEERIIESAAAEKAKPAASKSSKVSAKAIKAMAKKSKAVKKAQVEKASKKRDHHNGDFVALTLNDLGLADVSKLATVLYNECTVHGALDKGEFLSTKGRRDRECGKIRSAATRANKGSGRMSLGLMIRKYTRYLSIDRAQQLRAYCN